MSGLSDREVLGLLNGESIILDIAREVTGILRDEKIADGAVIGGLAVYLHGHRRATQDVDVFVPDSKAMADALIVSGFTFDPERREFLKRQVPVHLVTKPEIAAPPRKVEEIDDIRVVSLPDLIEMKLRSGLAKLTRAQDLADVIALIRVRGLTEEFASQIAHELRPEFRTLVKAVQADEGP